MADPVWFSRCTALVPLFLFGVETVAASNVVSAIHPCQGAVESNRLEGQHLGNSPPVIEHLNAILYNGKLYISGVVSDSDDDPSGQRVFIGGSIGGTTFLDSAGRFAFQIPCSYPYGEVTARTIDRRGAESSTAIIEFTK